jgi:tRNA-dihydrouridine synthase
LQIDQMSLEDGWKRYLSRAVRDKFHKPTVIAGNIRTPKVAEDIIASGDADLIAIGRGLIAEPEWVQKCKRQRTFDAEMHLLQHRLRRSPHRPLAPLRCSINPDIIHGDAYKQQRDRDTNVVVIGAGTAGMEAACTAAEVGCHTWLLEENTASADWPARSPAAGEKAYR